MVLILVISLKTLIFLKCHFMPVDPFKFFTHWAFNIIKSLRELGVFGPNSFAHFHNTLSGQYCIRNLWPSD